MILKYLRIKLGKIYLLIKDITMRIENRRRKELLRGLGN
jgi:hypothetical protein